MFVVYFLCYAILHYYRYTLSLSDARITIYFDRMLPRIITLARCSSDRRTRIAACEVLHSMVALIIGSTAKHLTDGDKFATFYTILCPALLALGCDSDDVVRDLFQPLTLQLMHWFSSRVMLLSPVSGHMLDSLFDALCEDMNPSLREFSGLCLAEFTQWCFKQMLDEQETQSNIRNIVHRIDHLALHPSARKRVAAAVAFNHLYKILREDDNTISMYWLKLFYCFVRSANGCDDPSIVNALSHIERVIKCKAYILNTVVQGRKKPHEFDDATLPHALYWLLSQCGVLDEHCRIKCMELYVSIAECVTGGSAREITHSFVDIYGINRLNEIILKDLEPIVENISASNVMALLKAVDYYTWLIEKQLLAIEMLLPVHEHVIICIHNFIRQLLSQIDSECAAIATIKSREDEQLQILQCKALLAILNFIQVLLNIDNVSIVLITSIIVRLIIIKYKQLSNNERLNYILYFI